MKNNNLWNRIFHRKEIEANKKQYELYKYQIEAAPEFISIVKNTKDLNTLLQLHKDIYASGFKCTNLGPGVLFRNDDIAKLTPHQVFLGGIYGLNTYAIPYWEQYVDEPFGVNSFGIDEKRSLYEIILNQYKNHLISNIASLAEKARLAVNTYRICNY